MINEQTVTNKLPPVSKTSQPLSRPEERPPEFGGAKGPEPTRYGDWEHKGRCSDF